MNNKTITITLGIGYRTGAEGQISKVMVLPGRQRSLTLSSYSAPTWRDRRTPDNRYRAYASGGKNLCFL